MAKHYHLYQAGVAHLESCIVDRNTHTIHIPRPVPVIRIHRDISDLFDDCDWMTEVQPTTRVNDQIIELNVHTTWWHENIKWKLTGSTNAIGTIVDCS